MAPTGDGTFQQKFAIHRDQLGGQLGQHKLTALQDGVVRAELTITPDSADVVH